VFERNLERATMDWPTLSALLVWGTMTSRPANMACAPPNLNLLSDIVDVPPSRCAARCPPLRPPNWESVLRFYWQGETGLCGRTSHRQAVDAGE
jgi:hypothetical protein